MYPQEQTQRPDTSGRNGNGASPFSITLLISTYNWVEALKRVLEGVARQTVMPDEIVIADDGSREDTADFIRRYAETSPVPVRHVWHEDKGFRRSMILNKAVATATGDYIIEMDGDVVPERHFVEDHRNIAEKGYFVYGGRIILTEDGKVASSHYFNCIRSRMLRNAVARFTKSYRISRIKGCNLAFWRKDFIRVNGYNEDIEGWGSEDHEFTARLYFSGIRPKRLKFGGLIRHIYHPMAAKNHAKANEALFAEAIASHSTRAANGVDKYLK